MPIETPFNSSISTFSAVNSVGPIVTILSFIGMVAFILILIKYKGFLGRGLIITIPGVVLYFIASIFGKEAEMGSYNTLVLFAWIAGFIVASIVTGAIVNKTRLKKRLDHIIEDL